VSTQATAFKLEKQNDGMLDQQDWGEAGMAISFLGRETCRPTNPSVRNCVLQKVLSITLNLKIKSKRPYQKVLVDVSLSLSKVTPLRKSGFDRLNLTYTRLLRQPPVSTQSTALNYSPQPSDKFENYSLQKVN